MLGVVDEVVAKQLFGDASDPNTYMHALFEHTIQGDLLIYGPKKDAQQWRQVSSSGLPATTISSAEGTLDHRQDLWHVDTCVPDLSYLYHNLFEVVDPEQEGLDEIERDLLGRARKCSKEHRSITNSGVLRTVEHLLLGAHSQRKQPEGAPNPFNSSDADNQEPSKRGGAMDRLSVRLMDARNRSGDNESDPRQADRFWYLCVHDKILPWPSSISKEWVFCITRRGDGNPLGRRVQGMNVHMTHDAVLLQVMAEDASSFHRFTFQIDQATGLGSDLYLKHVAEAAVGILLAAAGEDHTRAHQYIDFEPEDETTPAEESAGYVSPKIYPALFNVNVQWAARPPVAEAPLYGVIRPSEAPKQAELITGAATMLNPWRDECQTRASCRCSESMMFSVNKAAIIDTTSGEKFVAVSYVWNQYEDQELVNTLAVISRESGIDKFWVDRWCINQSCRWHKQSMIPKMGIIYSNATFVVALCPDITAAVRRNGDMEYNAGWNDDPGAALRLQFALCRWRSRSWTWQEGVMAKKGWYKTAGELISANELEHWVNCSTAIDKRLCRCPFCSQTIHRAGQHAGEVDTWQQTLWVNALNDCSQTIWGEILGRHHKWSLEAAMEATSEREASIPLDMLYSIVGAVEEVRGVKVDYQADLSDKLKEFVQAGNCALCLVTSQTVNRKPGACWMPEVVANHAWKSEVNWTMEDAGGHVTSDGLLVHGEDLGEVESTIETDAGLMVIGGRNTPWAIITNRECAAQPGNNVVLMRRKHHGVLVFAKRLGEEIWHRQTSADVGSELAWLPKHPDIVVKLGANLGFPAVRHHSRGLARL